MQRQLQNQRSNSAAAAHKLHDQARISVCTIMLKIGQSAEITFGNAAKARKNHLNWFINPLMIGQFAQLRNLSHVNCAVSHAHCQNVCACRTMRSPQPHATIAACGCNNLGADTLHLLQRATSRKLGGVAKSTGERALQHFHSSYLPPFWFLLFLYLREPATFNKWRGLLPSSHISFVQLECQL
jgi:hypothetical protein